MGAESRPPGRDRGVGAVEDETSSREVGRAHRQVNGAPTKEGGEVVSEKIGRLESGHLLEDIGGVGHPSEAIGRRRGAVC